MGYVPVQVKSTNCTVQRGTDHHKATGGEGDISNAAGVLSEGHETQAAIGVPHLHLKNTHTYTHAIWEQ